MERSQTISLLVVTFSTYNNTLEVQPDHLLPDAVTTIDATAAIVADKRKTIYLPRRTTGLSTILPVEQTVASRLLEELKVAEKQ